MLESCMTIMNYRKHQSKKQLFFSLFSAGGKWIHFEILNIPWSEELLDFSSQMFLNAKYVVERAVSEKYMGRPKAD